MYPVCEIIMCKLRGKISLALCNLRNILRFILLFSYGLFPDKPQVTLSGNQTVDEGRDAFIYCKAVAYPTPVKYNWFKNGKQIISDPNGDFVIDSLADGRSRLTVKQVRYEDRYNQTYRCSAANVMGTGKRKSFYFFVNCKLRFFVFLCCLNYNK